VLPSLVPRRSSHGAARLLRGAPCWSPKTELSVCQTPLMRGTDIGSVPVAMPFQMQRWMEIATSEALTVLLSTKAQLVKT